jgi:hypothetical protein
MEMTELRDAWFPPPGTAAPAFAAKHRIADHVRAITEHLVGLDVDALDDDQLDGLEDLAVQLREQLAGLPDRRAQGSLATSPLPDGALVERSPVSGRGNPLSPPLTYSFDGETTRAWAIFSQAYEGPPGGVHGGCIAAAFDEILGVAQIAGKAAGYTASLTVRYHRKTPLGRRVDYEAGLGDRDGRKMRLWARSTVDGELVAEAEGLFIAKMGEGSGA